MKIKYTFKKIGDDSLYKNSFYIMLGTLIMAIFGFLFWIINTNLFSSNDIGIATTLISITGIITGLSVLGMNSGIIRYLSKSDDKNKKINTCITLSAILSIIISAIFLMGILKFSPKLVFIKNNLILSISFIAFMAISSTNSIIDSVFIALRNSKYVFMKNSIFSILKLIFPFFLISLGAYGIFSSWMIALSIGLLFSFSIMIHKFQYSHKFVFHDSVFKKIGGYSLKNYLAGFIGGLPLLILPIIITNIIGPETTAYYYISVMIGSLLFAIPTATTQSLFAEGSYNENGLNAQIRKSIKIISLLLIPGILILIFFGNYILLIFGSEYSREGLKFLQIFSLSGIFVSINSIFSSVFKIKEKIGILLFINIISSLIIITLSYLLLNKGLIGIGISWMIGVAISSLIYFAIYVFEKR